MIKADEHQIEGLHPLDEIQSEKNPIYPVLIPFNHADMNLHVSTAVFRIIFITTQERAGGPPGMR